MALLTGYEGGALSTVAVNGQSTDTRATIVTIEEGEGPLYLFLASLSPMIWDFDGAVDRIKTVVVQRPRGELFGPGAAIAGLQENIVYFVDPASCITKIPTKDGLDLQRASLQLAESLGTVVTHAKAKYILQDLQMPSGTIKCSPFLLMMRRNQFLYLTKASVVIVVAMFPRFLTVITTKRTLGSSAGPAIAILGWMRALILGPDSNHLRISRKSAPVATIAA